MLSECKTFVNYFYGFNLINLTPWKVSEIEEAHGRKPSEGLRNKNPTLVSTDSSKNSVFL
jgi:hypothetical protein